MSSNMSPDVLGVVKEVGPITKITTKSTNRDLAKRELVIVDQSGFQVRLTLWGKQAETYDQAGDPVIGFKSVKVGDFGGTAFLHSRCRHLTHTLGRTLSLLSSGSMQVNPDMPEAHNLRGW